jgi:large subunit ribosomal protein L25
VGEAKGLKTAGAIMLHPFDEIEVECTVANIPDFIEVDMSNLDVGESIHAREITLPSDSIKLLTDPETVVATIVVQAEEVVEAEATEVAAGEGAEPEVIGEKKVEEEEEGKD